MSWQLYLWEESPPSRNWIGDWARCSVGLRYTEYKILLFLPGIERQSFRQLLYGLSLLQIILDRIQMLIMQHMGHEI
jgi:hypothetical protein